MNVLILLINLYGLTAGHTVHLTELADGANSLQGALSIPINQVTNGWKVDLTFTAPVSNLDVGSNFVIVMLFHLLTCLGINMLKLYKHFPALRFYQIQSRAMFS